MARKVHLPAFKRFDDDHPLLGLTVRRRRSSTRGRYLSRVTSKEGSRVWLKSEEVWATVTGLYSGKFGPDDAEYGDTRGIEHIVRVEYDKDGSTINRNASPDEIELTKRADRALDI